MKKGIPLRAITTSLPRSLRRPRNNCTSSLHNVSEGCWWRAIKTGEYNTGNYGLSGRWTTQSVFELHLIIMCISDFVGFPLWCEALSLSHCLGFGLCLKVQHPGYSSVLMWGDDIWKLIASVNDIGSCERKGSPIHVQAERNGMQKYWIHYHITDVNIEYLLPTSQTP